MAEQTGKRRFPWALVPALLALVNGHAYAVEAGTRLIDMATKLAETKQFSVNVHMTYDVVQDSGQIIEFGELRTVQISRPEYLRVDAQQSDGDTGGLIFDGTTLTQFNQTQNVYSQIEKPGTVDNAVRYAVAELRVRLPLARMLVTSFPQEMSRLTTDVNFVERNTLGPEPTDHIAGNTADLDYQVWIRDDNFPSRIVLTYRNSPGQPQFRADFSDWNTTPALRRDSFKYKPPADAEKIPTLLPASSASESSITEDSGE